MNGWIIGSGIGFGLFCGVALYHGLATRYYTIPSRKVPRGKQLRFVLLADLHSTAYGMRQEKLLRRIEAASPDAVLLAGDILDERRSFGPVADLLDGLRVLAPTFYATGNHEWRTEAELLKRRFRAHGAEVLDDRHVVRTFQGVPVLLAGTDDPERGWHGNRDYVQAEAVKTAFAGLSDREELKVLLAHKPERFSLYQPLGFDLVVSGHAHGGQVRIPGLVNGLWAVGQGFFPKYAGGLYDHGGMYQVVSRGLSYFWYLPRVFNRPEVVVIDVRGGEKNEIFGGDSSVQADVRPGGGRSSGDAAVD